MSAIEDYALIGDLREGRAGLGQRVMMRPTPRIAPPGTRPQAVGAEDDFGSLQLAEGCVADNLSTDSQDQPDGQADDH